MCQPGRPEPQGDGQNGSPGFEAFHKAKSDGERRPTLLDKEPEIQIRLVQVINFFLQTFSVFQQFPIAFTPGFQFSVRVSLRFVKSECIEVHAAFRLVRITVLDYTFDELNNLGDELGYTGNDIRLSNIKTGHVMEIFCLPVSSKRPGDSWVRDRGPVLQYRGYELVNAEQK